MIEALPENPFRSGLTSERPPEPCVIVIFGAGGDLALRKLFPALMHLAQDKLMPERWAVIGVFRRERDETEFREAVFAAAKRFAPDLILDDAFRREFESHLHVCADDPSGGGGYTKLARRIGLVSEQIGAQGNVLYYLSVPPSAYGSIAQSLGASGLDRAPGGGWRRLVVEKPFGHDLDSARELSVTLSRVFREEQIYRIDHYMGKETVQNILALRLANVFLEPLWNSKYIDHVQLTAAESIGVEDRAGYYEDAGALRDMLQNHLLQTLAMLAMEPPASLDPETIRSEKAKVLEAVRPLAVTDTMANAVRAQYSAGAVAGSAALAYVDERGVNPASRTETFAALRLQIDNWRWAGVPFYLRTGKRLPKRITEVAIQFKSVPHRVFPHSPANRIEPNVLAVRIQPQEGITLKFLAKLPGHTLNLRPVDMEFRYGTSFGGRISDAYERLLLDAMLGDPTLFARRDAVEESWKIVTPVLDRWRADPAFPLFTYPAGAWGPAAADLLIEQDNRVWRCL